MKRLTHEGPAARSSDQPVRGVRGRLFEEGVPHPSGHVVRAIPTVFSCIAGGLLRLDWEVASDDTRYKLMTVEQT